MKTPKRTVGKQKVVPFFCSACGGQTGETQIGRDIYCPPRQTKVTSLCYACGYSSSMVMPVRKK